jgi:hypothetical protein
VDLAVWEVEAPTANAAIVLVKLELGKQHKSAVLAIAKDCGPDAKEFDVEVTPLS